MNDFVDRLTQAVDSGLLPAAVAEEAVSAYALEGSGAAILVLKSFSAANSDPDSAPKNEGANPAPEVGADDSGDVTVENLPDPATHAEHKQDLADLLLTDPDAPHTRALLLMVAESERLLGA